MTNQSTGEHEPTDTGYYRTVVDNGDFFEIPVEFLWLFRHHNTDRGHEFTMDLPQPIIDLLGAVFSAGAVRLDEIIGDDDERQEALGDLSELLEGIDFVLSVKVDPETGDPLPTPLPCVLCKQTPNGDPLNCGYVDPCIEPIDDERVVSTCCGHGIEQPHINYREVPGDYESPVTVYQGEEAAKRIWPDPVVRKGRRTEMACLAREHNDRYLDELDGELEG